jgi:hypothetical protein
MRAPITHMQSRCNANAGGDQSMPENNSTIRFIAKWHQSRQPPGLLNWPKPPPGAVNVVLLRRLHIDSGGVSARLLLSFGFGESKARGFVSLNIKPNQSSA